MWMPLRGASLGVSEGSGAIAEKENNTSYRQAILAIRALAPIFGREPGNTRNHEKVSITTTERSCDYVSVNGTTRSAYSSRLFYP